MEIRPVGDLSEIAAWKQTYLDSLVGPLDGYWETAVIGLAPHYEMLEAGERVGYYAAKDGCLLQFFVAEPFLPRASVLFDELLAVAELDIASVSTVEPAFLSLCLDRQTAVSTKLNTSVSINTYLFRDHHPVRPVISNFPNAQFRSAMLGDLAQLVQFYQENDEYEDTEAIEEGAGGHESYVRELIEKGQVFLLIDNDKIIGIGECRISETQQPYADVGMIVNFQHRQQGVGVFILAQLKDYCYSHYVKPICSCAFDNIASRKTIEKAGFITQHRILDIQLQ